MQRGEGPGTPSFIQDLEGTRWREVYTYLDDQVVVNAHLEGGQSIHEVDLHENFRAIAGAGPGPRDGRHGGAGRDEPEGAGRAGGGPARGVAAVGEPQEKTAQEAIDYRASAAGGIRPGGIAADGTRRGATAAGGTGHGATAAGGNQPGEGAAAGEDAAGAGRPTTPDEALAGHHQRTSLNGWSPGPEKATQKRDGSTYRRTILGGVRVAFR